jgi:type II secretory pathway pseudopilin PulG
MSRMEARMSDANAGATRTLRRRSFHLREDEGGAAGVVAIMLAILVVILLVTMVTSVWMPVWMEKREANQIRQVTSDFGNIKATIDNQILQGDTAISVANPVTLGTEGFSAFGSDSSGTFSINHFRDDELEYYCNVRNTTGAVNVTCTGGMKYNSNNNYYVDQELAYENGAIILDQGDGEVVRIGPQLTVEAFGPVVKVDFVMITISGIETSIQGTSTILFQTQLVTYTSDSHLFITPDWLNFTLITEYTSAWTRYFNNTLIEAGLTPGTDYNLTLVGDSTIHVDIANVQFFDLGFALIKTDIEM